MDKDLAVKTLLDRWGIEETRLLGEGMTSAVYALDTARALKIFFGTPDLAYLKRLQRFYRQLDDHQLPFATPQIAETGWLGGVYYAIERRLPGRELAQIFPSFAPVQRQRSLVSFLDALPAIHAIPCPQSPYGELLNEWEPVQADSWRVFLAQRVRTILQTSYATVAVDVPTIDRLLDFYLQSLDHLSDPAPKQLVHGDYFFGNVLADTAGRLTAVIDFSPLTLVGDPVMDLAGAFYFCEIYDFVTQEDFDFLRSEIERRYGEAIFQQMDLYLLYYCFLFSGCKEEDNRIYRWCVRHLQQFSKDLGYSR